MASPSRHRRVKELYLAASERTSTERDAFLAVACDGDPDLRAEVEGMLAAVEAQPDFLEVSPVPRGTPETPPAPRRIGSFTIVGTLGEGGMGRVFLAEQDDPRRRVALKVLRYGMLLPRLLARFEQEKAVLARLQHPGIAQIFEAGTAEISGSEQPFFAMEYIDGQPLTAFAHAQELSLRARLELFVLVCEGVQHAHQKGVVHRDLKPANILVTADGQPKILDFGVARAADTDVQLTSIGADAAQIIGTLAYMSPEQAAGATERIDARADVYSLGVILYELLTGRVPHDVSTTSLPAAVRTICEQPAPKVGAIRRQLRGDLETIVQKALEKDAERRYASADALAADVRHYLCGEPIAARPASRLYLLAKFARRNRLLVGAVGAVIAALATGLWFAAQVAVQESIRRQGSERQAYCGSIRTAQAEIDRGEPATARRWLDATPRHLRDWEWRYLEARLEADMQQLLGMPHTPLFAAFVHGTGLAMAVDGACVVHVWDLTTEERIEVRCAELEEVPAAQRWPLALSNDGSLVLSRLPDGDRSAAILWQSTTGRVLQRFPVDRLEKGRAGAISPTGAHVVLEAADGLHLFEVEPARPIHHVAGAARPFAFSADGAWLVHAVGDQVRFWDVAANRPARPDVTVASGRVGEFALSRDRALLATATDKTIRVRDLATGHIGHAVHAAGDTPVYSLVFDPGGSCLVSNSNGALRSWNPTTGTLVQTFPGYRRFNVAPAFDAFGESLLIPHSDLHAGQNGERCGIRIFNRSSETPLVLRGHSTFVYPVAVSPDGSLIASGSFDGEIRLWDADTGERLGVFAHTGLPVHDLAFDPRGGRLLSASRSGRGQVGHVDVWDLVTGEQLDRLEQQSTSIAFSPDGTLLLVGDGRSRDRLVVFDATSFAEPRTVLPEHSGVVAFSHDGALFAAASPTRNTVAVLRTSTSTRALTLTSPGGVSAIAFAPDGRHLATGSWNGNLTLWDLDTRRPLGPVSAHVGEVFSVVFLGNHRVASGGRDGIIRIWDTAGGADADGPIEVVGLRGHLDYVYSLALSRDGERLVSGSGDGTVRIWETQPLSRRRATGRSAARLRADAEPLACGLFDAALAALPESSRTTVRAQHEAARRATEQLAAEPLGGEDARRAARRALLRLALERARTAAERGK